MTKIVGYVSFHTEGVILKLSHSRGSGNLLWIFVCAGRTFVVGMTSWNKFETANTSRKSRTIIAMMITTKSRYAIMAMVEIASSSEGRPISLECLALKQNIDLRYLEQIFTKLRRSGLVYSARGPGGGYILGIVPKDIKIFDIIEAVDENVKMTRCTEQIGCMPSGVKCNTHRLWEGLGDKIKEYFSKITVADLINDQASLPR